MANQKGPRPVDLVKKIRQRIERERKKAERKDLKFTAASDEELRRKLGKVNSPMIVFQSWNDAPPGGTVTYNVGITNPDSFDRSSLYIHVFVGPANPVQVIGRALQCVDGRFPKLTQPDFFGLRIASGDTESVTFKLSIPPGIEPSEYLGNAFLFQAAYHDAGTYFDRGCFPFTVT